jgi:hypothetical protein
MDRRTYTELPALYFEADVAQRVCLAAGVYKADVAELDADAMGKGLVVLGIGRAKQSLVGVGVVIARMDFDAVGYSGELV